MFVQSIKPGIFFVILILFVPVCGHAQSSIWSNDSTSKRVLAWDCDDKVFTRVEQIASLNIPALDFEDSLSTFLKSKNAFRDKDRIKFKFIVTTRSQIFDFEKLGGEMKREAAAKEAIVRYSSLWKPAVQNRRSVCSYVIVELNIEGDKLHVAISQ